MEPFRFPLERVLAWRRTQLELEESQFRRHLAGLAELDRQRSQWEGAAAAAERQIREWNPLAAGEIGALGGFRNHVRLKTAELAQARSERQKQADRQQGLMLDARRRVRLLERLRERRLAEWRESCDRELENSASESHLAKWSRPSSYNEEHDA